MDMSSSLCSTSCATPPMTFSATLTGGIQDVSALLPLLGTEQCEEHVSSALTKGYLYAAASPMSLFGSLGLTRAGFKTLLASVNFSIRKWNFNGATMLSNMGFQPQGENLSLIMADPEKKGHYVVESRLDSLLEELHLDETQICDVSHNTKTWNIAMITLTGLFSSMSMVPYVYLNTRAGSSLPALARWSFPALRAVGGFLISTTMQLTLQRRITTISKNWLFERIRRRKRDCVGPEQTAEGENEGSQEGDSRDAEKGLVDIGPKGDATDRLTWVLLVLLLLGDIASIVGYIGCFSVVQSATLSSGPVSWLCSEIVLSLVRIILWGLNPKMDDAPPLEFVLKLNDHPPLPTCNQNDDQIWGEKVLPLTRASPFLNSITSFAGLLKHFGRPGLTLYYTLTRAGPHAEWGFNDSRLQRAAHERVLYITIFDHKERTTRIFTRHRGVNYFYSTDVPHVDLKHDLLEVKLGKMINSKNDPIVGDGDMQTLLVEHYLSLIRSTTSRVGRNKQYCIGNAWTMKVADMVLAPGDGVDFRADEDDYLARDGGYLEQGSIEKERRSLGVKRGKWIETYMRQVISETREWILAEKASIKEVDGVLLDEAKTAGKRKEVANEQVEERESNQTLDDNDDDLKVVELWLIEERRCMEKLLVYEVEEWEGRMWKNTEEFIRSSGIQEKERVEWEWKANCWKRFNADFRAMNERMATNANVKGSSDALSRLWQDTHHDIEGAWQSAMKRFVDGPPPPSIISWRDRLEEDFRLRASGKAFRFHRTTRLMRQQQKSMESRLRKELDDVEFRLGQELKNCNQFWGSDELVRARHSRAKWISIPRLISNAELELYSRALKKRSDVIHITLFRCETDRVIETILRDLSLPSLTSALVRDDSNPRLRLPHIQRASPLFVDAYDMKISTFLRDNQSRLAKTHRTFIFISNQGLPPQLSSTEIALERPTLAISFLGPSSGNLTLRLRHGASRPDATLRLTVTGFPTFIIPIPSSLATNDITLRPHPSERLSFRTNSRNTLIIEMEPSYTLPKLYRLQDIELLNEAGFHYHPRPLKAPELSQVSSTFPLPTSPLSYNTEISSYSPVSLPAQRAKSEVDVISERTKETGDVKAE